MINPIRCVRVWKTLSRLWGWGHAVFSWSFLNQINTRCSHWSHTWPDYVFCCYSGDHTVLVSLVSCAEQCPVFPLSRHRLTVWLAVICLFFHCFPQFSPRLPIKPMAWRGVWICDSSLTWHHYAQRERLWSWGGSDQRSSPERGGGANEAFQHGVIHHACFASQSTVYSAAYTNIFLVIFHSKTEVAVFTFASFH